MINEGFSKVKEELMELFGTISVDELMRNHKAMELIKEISESLKDVSIVSMYF